MPKKVLIAEDDKNIRELLRLYIEKDGFETISAGNGREALERYHESKPDLVLLDIMMPLLDGWGVLDEIRKSGDRVPVIMLTAKGATTDKVSGLDMGADDYIVKPFEMQEVMARIHAVLRRFAPDEKKKRLEYEHIIIDMDSFDLTIANKRVDIPPKEFELLYFLASNPNLVFTRDQLLDKVWGFEYYGDTRTVDVHVKRLREKLEGVSEKWSLKTVWGVGYKFETAK